MYFTLYAKIPGKKRFYPMDYQRGVVVVNLIHATMFNGAEAEKLAKEIPALEELNDGWFFELRRAS